MYYYMRNEIGTLYDKEQGITKFCLRQIDTPVLEGEYKRIPKEDGGIDEQITITNVGHLPTPEIGSALTMIMTECRWIAIRSEGEIEHV